MRYSFLIVSRTVGRIDNTPDLRFRKKKEEEECGEGIRLEVAKGNLGRGKEQIF